MNFVTGIDDLDHAVPGGAFAGGSLVELYGESQSGKTALALRFLAAAQGRGDLTAWVATVPPPGPESIRWAGLDPDYLLILPQSGASPALPGTVSLLEAGVRLVVVDSLTACLSGQTGESLGTALATGLPMVKAALSQRPDALVVVTNQVRRMTAGRTTIPAGSGIALSRCVDYRIRLTPGEGIYRGGELVGRRILFRIDHTPGPMQDWYGEGFFSLYWEEGLKERGERRETKEARDADSTGSDPGDREG